METINFKKLFLKNICGIWLLILGSTAFTTYSGEYEEYENVKILITSEGGLQFSKEDSYDGRKIIYDCRLGLRDNGTITIQDAHHPRDMKSLIIKNCYELTLQSVYNGYYHEDKLTALQEVKITNVTSLTLSLRNQGISRPLRDIFEVSISNVQFLYLDDFFHYQFGSELFLKLQNVSINNLHRVFPYDTDTGRIAFNLYLKNVKINETEASSIYVNGKSSLNLVVEDSHFGNVHAEAFAFKGTAHIITSTFSFLDEAAFRINSSSPFLFSGNHVERMLNPFYILAMEVNIIDNTFDSIDNPWLSKIIGPETDSFRTLNITGNVINHWTHNLFYLNSQNFPDLIIFDGNYLNCSCKNAITLAYKFQKYFADVFLNKHQKNFCKNFGNCSLEKTLQNGSGICKGNFRCPEENQNGNDENAQMWPSNIKSILSVLKNIDTKLDQIVSKYNSSVADKPN